MADFRRALNSTQLRDFGAKHGNAGRDETSKIIGEAADEIDRLRKELEAWEERWKALRWCYSGCKEDSSSSSTSCVDGFGGTDPFGLGW